MKSIYSILLILIMSASNLFAQKLVYEPVKNKLSEDQISTLTKSSKALDRTKSHMKKAKAIEKKYAKLKKKKKKKYEKKIWEAKKYRITAANINLKSYADAVELYTAFLQENTFYFTDDKEKADELINTANDNINSAKDELSKFNKSTSKSFYKKKVKSSKLLNAVEAAETNQEEAYKAITQAIDIFLQQESKKQNEEAENNAWNRAKLTNSIASYQAYLSAYPTGKYAGQARAKIAKIRQQEAEALANKKPDYTFSVQIAASRIKISDKTLNRLVDDPSMVVETYTDDYYKYRIGSYVSYEEAYNFKSTLTAGGNFNKRRQKPFIVAFDKDGNQVEVTDEMKPEHLQGLD